MSKGIIWNRSLFCHNKSTEKGYSRGIAFATGLSSNSKKMPRKNFLSSYQQLHSFHELP